MFNAACPVEAPPPAWSENRFWRKFGASSAADWEASSPERARRNSVPASPANGARGPRFVDLTLYLPVSLRRSPWPLHRAANRDRAVLSYEAELSTSLSYRCGIGFEEPQGRRGADVETVETGHFADNSLSGYMFFGLSSSE